MTRPPSSGSKRRNRLVAHWDRQAGRAVNESWAASSRSWICSRAVGRVLDVCIGDGGNLPHYPVDIEVTGIDFSPGMIQAAGQRARRLGRSIDLTVADIENLPFADGWFDTVIATFALCCVPDERVALTEMNRVLKPGGNLLLADTVISTSPVLRVVERLADLVTVPLEGHYQMRRPWPIVESLGLTIIASQQEHHRLIERLHAIKPDSSTD